MSVRVVESMLLGHPPVPHRVGLILWEDQTVKRQARW